jgi:hypothetical protein
MSTASVPGQYPVESSHARLSHLGFGAGFEDESLAEGAAAPINVVTPLRSRSHTGQALEILGHALEYLVDSRMYQVDEPATRADSEALHILMRLSREVFEDRGAVIPSERRFRPSTPHHIAAN